MSSVPDTLITARQAERERNTAKFKIAVGYELHKRLRVRWLRSVTKKNLEAQLDTERKDAVGYSYKDHLQMIEFMTTEQRNTWTQFSLRNPLLWIYGPWSVFIVDDLWHQNTASLEFLVAMHGGLLFWLVIFSPLIWSWRKSLNRMWLARIRCFAITEELEHRGEQAVHVSGEENNEFFNEIARRLNYRMPRY